MQRAQLLWRPPSSLAHFLPQPCLNLSPPLTGGGRGSLSLVCSLQGIVLAAAAAHRTAQHLSASGLDLTLVDHEMCHHNAQIGLFLG